MHEARPTLYTALALAATAGVSVADLSLPPQIETIFFYTIPVLLCARTGYARLPYVITGVAVVWTLGMNIFQANYRGQGTEDILYEAINDFFGMLSIAGLAWFVSGRMHKERNLLDIIGFIDSRLSCADNDRVAAMIAMMKDSNRPPAGASAAPEGAPSPPSAS